MRSAEIGFVTAAGLLRDPVECSCLDEVRLLWLLRQGVSSKAIGCPYAVLTGRVFFDTGLCRYCPLTTGEAALIFGILDEPFSDWGDLQPIDLVAWSPRSSAIGTRLGVAFALGEEHVGVDGLGTTGLPIPVHRTPLNWLRANRRGLVIVDWEKAAYELRGLLLVAEDEGHRRELSRRLRLPPPAVTVTERRAAA